jgi:hypothetical protein
MSSPYRDADFVEPTKHRLFVTLASDATASTTDTLEVYETVCDVDNNNASYTVTIYLPSVAAAKGRMYAIRATDFGAGVIIADQDDSLEWSDLTTDADGEYTLLYSDGRQWFSLSTDIA